MNAPAAAGAKHEKIVCALLTASIPPPQTQIISGTGSPPCQVTVKPRSRSIVSTSSRFVQVGAVVGGRRDLSGGAFDLAVADDGTIFAATLEGVYWTRDKGETWVAYNDDLIRPIEFLEVSGDRLVAAAGDLVFSAPLP